MIECREVVRVYGHEKKGYPALRGVSFSIESAEFAAVMGPSGCGKSTLLNILGLLDRPTSGQFLFDDKDASLLGDGERTMLRRQTIGFVFQAFNLLPRLSALENVCLPMTYAGAKRLEREARARELLEQVGLGDKTGRTPLELSGGEKQRVGIARALANRPAMLLADEPTGNLDSKSSADILAMLQDLHKEGLTIILVTHDPNIAKGASRILRLKDGKLE